MSGMRHHHPGEGQTPCLGTSAFGTPCSNYEIDGLEYCLHHVPDDLLEEAEQITGFKRCRDGWGTPDGACRYFAVKGTSPPRCKNHGANVGSVISKRAAQSVIQQQAAVHLAAVLAEHGERLLNAPPIDDPLTELLLLAGEMREFKQILRERIARLDLSSWRYANSRAGEQVRAEILLYERSLERLATILERIARLDIDKRLAKVEEVTLRIIEMAFDKALNASGAGVEGQHSAREVLKAELRAVS